MSTNFRNAETQLDLEFIWYKYRYHKIKGTEGDNIIQSFQLWIANMIFNKEIKIKIKCLRYFYIKYKK